MLLCEDATLVNCTSSTTPWVGVVANLDSILKISMEFEMQRRNTEKEKEWRETELLKNYYYYFILFTMHLELLL